MINVEICKWLKVERDRLDMTQQQLADKLDKARTFVTKAEAFEREITVEQFIDLCIIYDLPIGETLEKLVKNANKASTQIDPLSK